MTPKIFARRGAAVAATAGLFSLLTGSLGAQPTFATGPDSTDPRTVLHVLNRVTFGPRPGDIERVEKMGITAFIDEQLHPDKIDDSAMNTRLADFSTLTMSSRDLSDQIFQPAQQVRKDAQVKQAKAAQKEAKSAATVAGDPSMTMDPNAPKPPVQPGQAQLSPEARMLQQQQQNVIQELMQAKILRAAYSDRQLEEVLTDFWFNHFNVYAQKGQVRNYLTSYERDVIRPHVLGSFRDLLGATAHSPAMLFYLDNWQSAAPNAQPLLTPELQRRLNNPRLPPQQRQQMMARLDQAKKAMPKGLNENYGRELMELHTLGVDGGYTQKDVQEVARALTGWTIDRPQQGGGFVFRPQMHDTGEKTILGYHFPAGHGEDEGERVLDILAKSPQTAHHIAFELAQRFVSDKPPASLVDRTAKVFLDTNGDLRQVVRSILTSPEFYAEDAYRAKVKTPLEFVVSAVRATDATVANAQPIIAELRGNLGMPLYGCQPPTGYSMTADAWVNTGALLERMNFALQLVSNQPGQGRPGGPGRPGGAGRPGGPPPPPAGGRAFGAPGPGGGRGGRGVPMQVDLATLAPDTTDASRDHLLEALLAGQVSDSTMKTLTKAQTPQQLVALTLGAPEFQRR